MNVVFMGTPDYAVRILRHLKEAGFNIKAVFTQPDKPVGRKQILTPSEVKIYAKNELIGVPVFTPNTLKDEAVVAELKAFEPKFIVVAAYGKILPQNVLDVATCINLHASILPKYRGASPIQSAILAGEKQTGVTAMLMDAGLDTGDMLDFIYTPCESKMSSELFSELGELGGELIVKVLKNFENLSAHALRVIRYAGNNKLSAVADNTASKGAAVGFEGLLKFINGHLPRNPETLKDNGQITSDTDYPPLVIREIVANQIVHQDFSVKGSSPTIEIFDNRVVFTNPGSPLNRPERLLDMPPYSRNEALAELFRKMHLVESRGSGIDKIILTLELNHLPAPDIAAKDNYTVVTLHQRRTIQEMGNREKINAIYYHSALLYIEDNFMTNSTLRKRFGLTNKQSSIASKLIALALENDKIKIYDENAGKKNMQYIPYWGISYNNNSTPISSK